MKFRTVNRPDTGKTSVRFLCVEQALLSKHYWLLKSEKYRKSVNENKFRKLKSVKNHVFS